MRKGNSGVSAGRKRRDGALRIVMLGHKRIPSREGGIEIVVDELASRMAEKGFAVTCINRGGHHVSGRQFDEARRKEYRGIRLITVPTIDGNVKFSIPEGTQNGAKHRLKGKGIKVLQQDRRGDQYVKLYIEVPKNLNKKQKDLLRAFEDSLTDKNYAKRESFLDKLKDLFKG